MHRFLGLGREVGGVAKRKNDWKNVRMHIHGRRSLVDDLAASPNCFARRSRFAHEAREQRESEMKQAASAMTY